MNDEMQKKIESIITETIQIFEKKYSKATKLVITKAKLKEMFQKQVEEKAIDDKRNKEVKYWENHHKGKSCPEAPNPEPKDEEATYEKLKEYYLSQYLKGFKGRRPRPNREKVKPPSIITNVNRFHIVNTDADPYCLYYIHSFIEEKEGGLYHRYSDFKNLNKALKSFVPKEAVLPKQSSAFGKRNLEEEFLKNRVQDLSEYLKALTNTDGINNQECFLKFIDLAKDENEFDRDIFKEALLDTKKEINYWGELIYEYEEGGLCSLVLGKIINEIWGEIEPSLPTQKEDKDAMLKKIYKIINSYISKLVPSSWKNSFESSRSLREPINKVLGDTESQLFETKNDLKQKLNSEISKFFFQIKENIKNVLMKMSMDLIPEIITIFTPLIKFFIDKINPILKDVIDTGETAKTNEIEESFNFIIEEIKTEINKNFDYLMQDQITKIEKYDMLSELKTPLNLFNQLFTSLLDMINCKNWIDIFITIFQKKQELQSMDDLKTDVNEEILQRELDLFEDEIIDLIYKKGAEIGYKANNIRYNLWHKKSETNKDLGEFPDFIYKIGLELKCKLHKEVFKKFVQRITDDIWIGKVVDKKLEWTELVETSFKNGFEAAKKKFIKNIGVMSKNIIEETIINSVSSKIMMNIKEDIKENLNSIEKSVPPIIQEFINVDDDLYDCIVSKLSKGMEIILDNIVSIFINEFNNIFKE